MAAAKKLTERSTRLKRSALGGPIRAITRYLCEQDAEEIGEFLDHQHHVLSDFRPSEILRGLTRRVSLPQCHHRKHRHTVQPASPLRPLKVGLNLLWK